MELYVNLFVSNFISKKEMAEPLQYEVKCVCYGKTMESNVYLIHNYENPYQSVLVDVSRKWCTERIIKGIKEARCLLKQISLIILTHSHYDHVEGLKELKKHLPNAEVLIHEKEAAYLTKGDFKMPKGSWFFSRAASWVGRKLKNGRDWYKYDGVKPNLVMRTSQEKLPGFPEGCFILHTPGHSDGSISVVLDNGEAIVGDTMYNRLWGWLRNYASFNDNLDMVFKQWQALLDNGCVWFYPGHGTRIGVEWIKKYLSGLKVE